MRAPAWYVTLRQPGRWGIAGSLVCALAGAVCGFVEGVMLYPLGSWFAVTLYLAMLGSLAGLILGLAIATLTRRT